MKYNELKAKKGIDLLQHLIDYFHAQTRYIICRLTFKQTSELS